MRLVEPERVRPYLEHTGLVAAQFEAAGRHWACVSINYQLYGAQFPDGGATTGEIEFVIVVAPRWFSSRLPRMTFAQYVRGEEQTKLVGNLRIHVACDSDRAIEAGQQLFGEPKFKARLTATVPSVNGPATDDWAISCYEPDPPGGESGPRIFSWRVDLAGIAAVPASVAPITQYGFWGGRLIAAPWNILQPLSVFPLTPALANRVSLSVGPSSHRLATDLVRLLDGQAATSVFTVQSPPVAVQHRAYFA